MYSKSIGFYISEVTNSQSKLLFIIVYFPLDWLILLFN